MGISPASLQARDTLGHSARFCSPPIPQMLFPWKQLFHCQLGQDSPAARKVKGQKRWWKALLVQMSRYVWKVSMGENVLSADETHHLVTHGWPSAKPCCPGQNAFSFLVHSGCGSRFMPFSVGAPEEPYVSWFFQSKLTKNLLSYCSDKSYH